MVGLVITLIGFFWSDDILVKMNTPPEIMEDARVYLTILLAGVYSTVIYNLLSSTIMALGDSKTPLIFLIIACFLNGAMDYIFIVTFKMGIAGAAWATVIAQFLSGLLCLIYIMHRAKILILRWEDWRGLTCLDLWRSIRLGLPMGFQTCIIALGCIVVQIALNKLGPVAVAAFTTANKVDFFAMAPMMSFGMAMATYVGQNYGAGKFDRIKDGVHRCCRMSLTFTVFISLINIYYGSYFVSLFVGKEEVEVIQLSHVYMALNASMYWVLAFLFIYRYTLQGLGQSVVPTFAGVMELVMRLAAVEFLVVPLGFGGVCLASPLAWIGSAVPLAIAYYWTLHRLFARIKRALP